MIYTLPFPNIDPVLLELGPLVIRWYSLAYIIGIIAGWRYGLALVGLKPSFVTAPQFENIVLWVTMGIILGGRLGYVLFYNFDYFYENPGDILKLWHGGMSFHGGLLGVIAVVILYARLHHIRMLPLFDILACAAPIGIFLGRLANFVNGELYGRVTNVPWAMIFPGSDGNPRHPSQLYEAFLEGIVLFVVLAVLVRRPSWRVRAGLLAGVFILGYSLARFFVEFFREPDSQLGYIIDFFTMGQLLCIPMMLVGITTIIVALKRPLPANG